MQNSNINNTSTSTSTSTKIKFFLITCAMLMFSNILIGTLGAHLWHSQLVLNNGVANFATARDYLFIHTLSILFLALLDNKFPEGRFNWVAGLQLASIMLFSGSLILYALTGEKWLSNITPSGGSGLMLSWLLLVWRACKIK
ncbi:DUF423 domain-containing protein [Moritella sp. Urea-trap-13]|uniref:DUF423 domain-containing protein n=1 Tax=Moritella sp. Urea-trap-13 TaxID=2058327 RepID=UPI000C34967D|nr:DUF423 domain-containing protein [Moritella sp. Urea-trap-13]PKH09641.1 DUF423 domain-containing protein [Moritella sp. Urea-trap-13]